MMKIKVISRWLKSTDIQLDDYQYFSQKGYTGNFGKQYAILINDQDRSNPTIHRFVSYDLQMVKGVPIWFAFSPKIEYFYDYEVVDYSISWSFISVLTDKPTVRVFSRAKLSQVRQLAQYDSSA